MSTILRGGVWSVLLILFAHLTLPLIEHMLTGSRPTIVNCLFANHDIYPDFVSVTDQTPFMPQSRRTSSHMGVTHQPNGGYDHGARHPHAGYSASRSRESFSDFAIHNGYQGQSNYNGPANNGYSPGGYGPRQDMRKRSDPALNRYGTPGVYPAVGNSRSKDTLNTGASSGSDQWNASTGPTSEEGSVERVNGLARPVATHFPSGTDIHSYSDDERGRPRQLYGTQGMGARKPAPNQRPSYGNGTGLPPNQAGPRPMLNGPAPPAHKFQLNGPQVSATEERPTPEKKPSWLKRTFSKNK